MSDPNNISTDDPAQRKPRRPPLMLTIPKPSPTIVELTDTSPTTPKWSTLLRNTSKTPSKSTIYNPAANIYQGESWSTTFERGPATPPSEIIPGLYLSNMKTAGAYLTGRANGKNFPPISRILTILPEDMARYGYANMPEPSGAGSDIMTMTIEKLDLVGVNLLEDFDRAGEFINDGIKAYSDAIQTTDEDVRDRVNEILNRLAATKLNDDIKLRKGSRRTNLQNNSMDSGQQVNTPQTPLNRAFWSQTTSATSPLTATGSMSRNASNISPHIANVPFDGNLILPHSSSHSNSTISKRKPRGPAKTNMNQKGGVLVHCHAGISRSATLIIAYLLKYHAYLITNTSPNSNTQLQNPSYNHPNDPVMQMTEFVRSKRGIVNPNMGFRMQLLKYVDLECSLRDEKGVVKGVYVEWLDDWGENEK